MSLKQPSVFVLGIQIDEPVTSITALLISFVCLYAFIKLTKTSRAGKTNLYLRYYFLIMAAATANGGIIGHAFLYYFSFAWKLVGWILSMVSIMLLERASIEYAGLVLSKRLTHWLQWINLLELTFFISVTCLTLQFFFVELHTTYGLLIVVASLHLFVYKKTKSKESLLFLIAVGCAAISALIYMNQWDISIWFNHSDISHILLMIAAWFFYTGAKQMAPASSKDLVQH